MTYSKDIRTKIICTVGPSVDTEEKISAMVKKGMTIVRMNCSHGDAKSRFAHLQRVRQVEKKLKRSIGVMLDLQGPKLRVADLPQPFLLNSGEVWQLSFREMANAKSHIIPITFKNLSRAVKIGDKIFMDDGLIQTKVIKKNHDTVWVEVEHGGTLESRKGINIPAYRAPLKGLSHKDREDLLWGLKHNVDFVALSFVRTAREILALKAFIKKHKPQNAPQVIAKIEKPEGVENMDDIVRVSDGILVARGDLGIELDPEKVPVVQKTIIERCRVFRKPVIVATQMLDSMRQHPLPTRAEVSDVASAIYAGADAVLLTGETSTGKYPVEACYMMQKIAREVENHLIQKTFRKSPDDFGVDDSQSAFMFNVMQVADDLGAKAIVMLTRKGNLTRVISKLHPKQPIFSMANDLSAYRQLNLLWGVFPIEVTQDVTIQRIGAGLALLRKNRVVAKNDRLIFVYRDYKTEYLNLKVVEV